jgi:DNA-binding transcriptional ArsR family regulator
MRMMEQVAQRFRALGEPQRLRILQVLKTGGHSVNEIVAALDANQPNISRHLQALFEVGIVTRRREGNSIFYSIADPVVFQLCDLVCESARKQAEAEWKAARVKAASR